MLHNAAKSPCKTLNATFDKIKEEIQYIKNHNQTIGIAKECLTRLSDTFAGFPLIQQMVRQHNYDFVPLNLEYFLSGTGVIKIKLLDKFIILEIGFAIGFRILYGCNWFKSKFKKEEKIMTSQQFKTELSLKLS